MSWIDRFEDRAQEVAERNQRIRRTKPILPEDEDAAQEGWDRVAASAKEIVAESLSLQKNLIEMPDE